MKQYLPQENMQKHSIATEVIMSALAERLEFDRDIWGIAGLLHDLDYSETKDDMKQHGLLTEETLKEKGVSKEITDAMEKAYKFPRQAYVVTIIENMPENISVGGILNIDKKE